MTETETSSRQALVNTATRLFLEKGYDSVSMEQIRQVAKVSNGSLYHHFPSKAHLARGVYLTALEDYHRTMMGAISAETSAREGVHSLVTNHITWVLDSPQKAVVLERLRPFASIDGLAPDWGAVNAEAFSLLKSWIALQVARGDMRKLPFKVWLALVLGPSMQLSQEWAKQERPSFDPQVLSTLANCAWMSVKLQSSLKGLK